jgi:hypothetical protein
MNFKIDKQHVRKAESAIDQYTKTGKVSGEQVAKDSLSSVGQQLRGLQATSDAANPDAIKTAVKNGSAGPVVAHRKMQLTKPPPEGWTKPRQNNEVSNSPTYLAAS